MDTFSAEKTRGDSYWIMDAAAPNGNHYWQVEIVHIVSIAPSWRPNISSGIFAPAVRVIPRLRSNRHGICEFALFCYSAASSLFLSYRNIFSLPVTAQRFFSSCHYDLFSLSVTPASFLSSCHSGLDPESRMWRAGCNQRKLVGGLRLSRTEGLRS